MRRPQPRGSVRGLLERLPKPKDTDPPSLLFAASIGDPSSIDLVFSESLDRASAVRPDCYAVPGGAVSSAVLTSDREVRLKVSPPLAAERQPRVRVSCVADRAGNKVLDEWSEAAVSDRSVKRPGAGLHRLSGGERIAVDAPPGWKHPLSRRHRSIALPAAGMPEGVAHPKAGLLVVAEGMLNIPFDHRYEFDLISRKFARTLSGRPAFPRPVRGGRSPRDAHPRGEGGASSHSPRALFGPGRPVGKPLLESSVP